MDKPELKKIPGHDRDAEIAALRQSLASLQNEVLRIDKSESRGFELMKWAMGVLATLAVLFAGFNWWTGRTNYDRDRENLRQESVLLERKLALHQQELALDNQKQAIELRSHFETNFAHLTSLNEKQLISIREESLTTLRKLVAERAMAIQTSVSNLMALSSNLSAALQEDLKKQRQRDIDTLNSIINTNSSMLTRLITQIDSGLSKAEAMGFVVQANQCCFGNKLRNVQDYAQFAVGVSSYVSAAEDWLKAGDEGALRQALDKLLKFFPMLSLKWSLGALSVNDDLQGISKGVDALVVSLKDSELRNRYDIEATRLDLYNQIYKKAVKEDKERMISKRR